MIKNRLQKNLKKLAPWARRHGIGAYRLYDRDIPEFPFIVDVYEVVGESRPYVLVADRRESVDFTPKKAGRLDELQDALRELLAPADIVIKRRRPQRKGGDKRRQYQKRDNGNQKYIIVEEPARFYVNLYDYLDTGVFLDHRLVRQRVLKLAQTRPKMRMLNLFCYTGTVSVDAALGGARTTNVDLSKTYIQWARENFAINGLNENDDQHQFIIADARAFLADAVRTGCKEFDLIFLDPPTFSNSKNMNVALTGRADFEVERDQVPMIKAALQLLNPGGLLIFSNNKRDFKLDPEINNFARVKEVSRETLPADFHDAKIRRVYEITNFE